MKSKEKQSMDRSKLAERVSQVADMIREGSVRVGDMSSDVPEQLHYELELEEENHEVKLELEVEWPRTPTA